jgi:hypothetical protein
MSREYGNMGTKPERSIIVDFSNILIASVSFMDQAFGKMAFEYSKEDLRKKLLFINM